MSPNSTGVAARQTIWLVLVVAAVLLSGKLHPARAQQTSQAAGGALYVITFVDIIPTNRETGTKAVQQYAADTRKVPGVVRIEAVAQSNRENHLVIFEVWQNQKAFEAHERRPTQDSSEGRWHR